MSKFSFPSKRKKSYDKVNNIICDSILDNLAQNGLGSVVVFPGEEIKKEESEVVV